MSHLFSKPASIFISLDVEMWMPWKPASGSSSSSFAPTLVVVRIIGFPDPDIGAGRGAVKKDALLAFLVLHVDAVLAAV